MGVKSFDAIFNLNNQEEERRQFVNRIEVRLFNRLEQKPIYKDLYPSVCYHLGEDYYEIVGRHPTSYLGNLNFHIITKKDFHATLRLLMAIQDCMVDWPDELRRLSELITEVMSYSPNLGVRWSNGIFYPEGDSTLDRDLIDNFFQWLNKYPNEKQDLRNALDCYNRKDFHGVIQKCYTIIEGLARKVLNNTKTLDNNRADLLKEFNFNKNWGNILNSFFQYANDNSRHAGENRHQINDIEVHSYLYLTCAMVRMIALSAENKS